MPLLPEICVQPVKMLQQEAAEQVVIAKPYAVIIQWQQKQIVAIKVADHAQAVIASGQGITQAGGEAWHGRAQQ